MLLFCSFHRNPSTVSQAIAPTLHRAISPIPQPSPQNKMSIVAINGRYAEATAEISQEAAYLAPAAAPNQELQTVPAGEAWELIGASITATTSATAGNRTIRVRVRNSAGNVFYQTAVGANIAASQAGTIQNFLIGGTPALAAGVFAPAGLIVEAVDAAAIDAAADVINLHLVVRKHFSAL